VTTYASPKLGAYASLAGLGLLGALLVGRPEPAALAAPFALACVVGLTLARRPRFEFSIALDRARALEGEEVFLDVEIVAHTPIAWLQIHMPLPAGLEVGPEAPVLGLRLAAGERSRLSIPIRCRRWGAHRLGQAWVRTHDALGFFFTEGRHGTAGPLRVYPRPELLRSLLRPTETQVFAGNQRSRRRGEGIEFADVRPFGPGDRLRRVNWRLTTRLGALYVNDQHPERNADVVLLLDAFSDVSSRTLELAVRAVATLADHYLRQRDRVGLLSFGGTLRWLLAATGTRQAYRIVDALLETQIFLSYAWKGVELIPPRTLPPQALVVAVSPLLDKRTIQALFDLRARGFELAVVEVSPVPFLASSKHDVAQLGFRLWKLRREVLRLRFRRLGVPVGVWTAGEPLAAVVEEVQAFRRSAHLARV
jgi:uncharacterized protein (DUF58 family)